MLKPIPVKISQSKYAAEKGQEKKYIKKSITVANQKLLPDDTSSQFLLIESKRDKALGILMSLFQNGMSQNAEIREFARTHLSKEELKVLSEVSKDV